MKSITLYLFYSTIYLLVFAPLSACAQQSGYSYPEAERSLNAEMHHGISVKDPYQWMENLDSDTLHTWMGAQDELTMTYLSDKNMVSSLQNRIAALRNYATVGAPILRGDVTFLTRRKVGQVVGSLYYHTKKDTQEQLLIDIESILNEGNSAYVTSMSPSGTWVTYSAAEGQSRWRTTHILPVMKNAQAKESLTGFYGGRSNITWKNDDSGFFYTRYDIPEDPQAPLGIPSIYFHEVGTYQNQDRLIYTHSDSNLSFSLRVTHDDNFLVISGSKNGGTFNGLEERIFYLPLDKKNAEVKELFSEYPAQYAFEGSDGSLFRVRTSLDAPNLRLIEVDLKKTEKKNWRVILPEQEESIQAISEVGKSLVVQYTRDARTVLRVYDHKGALINEIDRLSPSVYGLGDNRIHSKAYYGVSNLTDPGAIYELDVTTGKDQLFFRPELPFDPDNFATKQVFYESKDGTRVPMFLIHQKGLELNGENPVFLYSYGVWSWSAFPWQQHMIPWIEAGGIYAVANIRGGGEYGESWHQAGIKHNKQNGIDDYIAAAEWLIENDYTSSQLMVANGGSASGVLPGAAIIQRPDLFGAAVINFPTLDKIRFPLFGSAKSWIPEFGDPSNKDDFQSLYAYSPYHNVQPGTCYPPTWIHVGEKDETTTPMHGYKFTAQLQHAQGCNNPILLKIAWGAGHSYGLTPEQGFETQAQELAFLFKALSLREENP
ncbi:MAG: prolyl oligopeptidase family serine peptidase [Rhodothermaceae bacterium]|nr:prolyl oligopeptidase family serine peptidase [Rhodothermaceae bacterium]